MTRTTLIFGAGFSGQAYGTVLAQGHQTVFGTTRSAEKFPTLVKAGMTPLVFDGQNNAALNAAINQVTDIVISIGPDDNGDAVLNALSAPIAKAPNLKWLAYLSTVGVYGNHDGGWVDEATQPKPVSKRSVQRVRAEMEWMKFAADNQLPLSILRLSGIYGPGRNQMISLEKGTARRMVKRDQVFNRIHVSDIAGALDFLAQKRANGIYNVTDDLPAPPQDVVAYCAALMKIDPPDEIDFETATLSPMARSFYGENKRVSNARIKSEGFRFDYPDYKQSFQRMWQEDKWR